MSYCKHEWTRRDEELRRAFGESREHEGSQFFVCRRCLRIREVRHEQVLRRARRERQPARAA